MYISVFLYIYIYFSNRQNLFSIVGFLLFTYQTPQSGLDNYPTDSHSLEQSYNRSSLTQIKDFANQMKFCHCLGRSDGTCCVTVSGGGGTDL